MSVSDRGHDGQAEAGSFAGLVAVAAGLAALEGFQESGDGFGRNARAAVGDLESTMKTPGRPAADADLTVPAAIEAALHRYLSVFGLVFGCFDFALTGDGGTPENWVFIECNPNGQWGWLPDAGDITEAFADILSTSTEGGGAR